MYSITMHLMTMSEAIERFKGIIDFTPPWQECTDSRLLGTEMVLPSPNDTDPAPLHTLLIWVPGTDWEDLRGLVSRGIWTINWPSENLMLQQSFAVLGPEENGLYVPMRGAESLMLHGSVKTVRIILVGDEHVVDAQHHFTGDDLDSFTVGCQGVMTDSGPNYKPYRLYEEEHLEAVAHLSNEFVLPGRIVGLYEAARQD